MQFKDYSKNKIILLINLKNQINSSYSNYKKLTKNFILKI